MKNILVIERRQIRKEIHHFYNLLNALSNSSNTKGAIHLFTTTQQQHTYINRA